MCDAVEECRASALATNDRRARHRRREHAARRPAAGQMVLRRQQHRVRRRPPHAHGPGQRPDGAADDAQRRDRKHQMEHQAVPAWAASLPVSRRAMRAALLLAGIQPGYSGAGAQASSGRRNSQMAGEDLQDIDTTPPGRPCLPGGDHRWRRFAGAGHCSAAAARGVNAGPSPLAARGVHGRLYSTITRTRARLRTWANGVAALPSRCAATRSTG